MELELLIDLHDLHGLQADVDVLEEVVLDHHREDRGEGERRDEGIVAELGGGGLVEGRGIVGLDGTRVLANLLASDDEDIGVAMDHPSDVSL